MYIPSARQPIGYIECPVEHDKNYLPHVRLDSINASSDVFCPKSACKIVPKKTYMMLLTTVTDKGMYISLPVPLFSINVFFTGDSMAVLEKGKQSIT